MENKKIKGATTVDLEGIHFKSKLEKSCYLKLVEAGLFVQYEPYKVHVWTPQNRRLENIEAYQPSKSNRKEVEAITRPLLPITYTPDFLVIKDRLYCFFDAKGYANDRYPIKKKMFLDWLASQITGIHYKFFEVHSVAQINHAIQIIKSYDPTGKNQVSGA